MEIPKKGVATIKQDFNELIITIPAQKNWLVIVFSSIWMVGWFFGETFAISMLFSSDTPIFANLFILFWLTFWTLGGFMIVFNIFWMLFGKEVITFQRQSLKIARKIGELGRSKEFDLKQIKFFSENSFYTPNAFIRQKRNRSLKSLDFTRGALKFDYGMETFYFAKGISQAEAKKIVEKLKTLPFVDKAIFA